MDRIPLQIFIADVQGHPERHRCVVFFIGDFNVDVEKRVAGFYSEQESLVRLFVDVFRSMVSHFGAKAV